jgi:AraC-like DNA-binding protein
MKLTEIFPGEKLKPYIKCFYFYEAHSDVGFDDVVFPSGNMEVIFNMGEGTWKVRDGHAFHATPPVELWGQITRPLPVRSLGKNIMLGVRFYAHSAAYFFKEDVSEFNNTILDGANVFGPSIKSLHAKLLATPRLDDRITVLENYLVSRLAVSEKKHHKIRLVGEITNSLKNSGNERIMTLSVRNNISTRYLNQLFSRYTGLTPKLYCKINRFQYTLNLITTRDQNLTSIGYDSGYFDQSHFIREFKLFTGITPTSFSKKAFPINQILASN